MRRHSNAALNEKQRLEVKRLHQDEGISIRALAARFQVNPTTIQRWVKRETGQDKPMGPRQPHRIVTNEYKQSILSYREQHPTHGPIRIAQALKAQFEYAHRGTILSVLQKAELTRIKPRPKSAWHIPQGKHRVQADIQQLPAIAGNSGFEYKYSFIHLSTRMKYSEIHPTQSTELAAQVLQRALLVLPPFSSVDG